MTGAKEPDNGGNGTGKKPAQKRVKTKLEPKGATGAEGDLEPPNKRQKAGSNSAWQVYENRARELGCGYDARPRNKVRFWVHKESDKVVARMFVCSIA